MKIKNIAYIILSGGLILSSCNDFVDLQPISSATAENAYQTAKDAEAALTGVYD